MQIEKVTTIHHIEINVRSIEESLRFYRLLHSFFTESQLEETANYFNWKFDGFYFFVNQVQSRFATDIYHRKQVGLDHLAFKLEGIDRVRSLEQFLISHGVPILYKADWYGPKYFAVYCEDPDRFKLEFGADV